MNSELKSEIGHWKFGMEEEKEEQGTSSPGLGGVSISDTIVIDELLHFTLSSHSLALSSHYTAALLNSQSQSEEGKEETQQDSSGHGVPSYPLYKHLSTELTKSFQTGFFPFPPADQPQQYQDWDTLISKSAFQLTTMYANVDFELHVQQPFFSQLQTGTKTVEGRLAAGYYNNVAPGSLLLFNKCLLLQVQRVTRYESFLQMLQVETLANVLPGVATFEEGVAIYRKFYSEEKEKSYGVLAISVSKPSLQPYDVMTEILTGLGYDGIGRLLGMARTAGTVLEALPPSRPVLVSSAANSYQPDIKSSALTDAARALAKHAERSSEGWWGHLQGNDSNKNQLASEVISRLLDDCCWMNIHLIQPYGPVFEIRVLEGYGARWSDDGSKFIGFLEPYMADGFSKDWKH